MKSLKINKHYLLQLVLYGILAWILFKYRVDLVKSAIAFVALFLFIYGVRSIWNLRSIRSITKSPINWVSKNWKILSKNLFFYGIGIAFILFLNLGIHESLVVIYFVSMIIFKIESRLSLELGIVFILLTAILTTLGSVDIAEQLGVFAFFFLSIGVVQGIISNVLNKSPQKVAL